MLGKGVNMLIEVLEKPTQSAVLKVVGVGGCGGNAINHMIEKGMNSAEYIAINTDAQDLKKSSAEITVQIGGTQTRGLGAGAKPEVGRMAAEEDRERIQEVLHGADLVFIAAGMGGGTGTGAAPIVAEVAKELGILTVAVVTKPFEFERRMKTALEGIDTLCRNTDSLIIVPNEKLFDIDPDITQAEAFRRANDVLFGAVAGIAEVIKETGHINADFADVRTVMSEPGLAMMASGSATGADRARTAVENALSCPLLEGSGINGARGVIVNITASQESLRMSEVREVLAPINERVAEDARVVFGTVYKENMGEEIRVTIIATGLGSHVGAQQRNPSLQVVRAAATGTDSSGAVDYSAYEKPSVFRPRNPARGTAARAPQQGDLNFPTFLRKQAD